ncbi:hypothetical protein HNY73_023187 [Argiope bruennichi]|uniref:Uncharacterized protein n=1 Tax=Argiope bruennichi TaxID=94029 RepID=A0A8T0E4L6_ARGBR|nr:hypothetical protein HNY73_023187 [Argiope bruennichi]
MHRHLTRCRVGKSPSLRVQGRRSFLESAPPSMTFRKTSERRNDPTSNFVTVYAIQLQAQEMDVLQQNPIIIIMVRSGMRCAAISHGGKTDLRSQRLGLIAHLIRGGELPQSGLFTKRYSKSSFPGMNAEHDSCSSVDGKVLPPLFKNKHFVANCSEASEEEPTTCIRFNQYGSHSPSPFRRRIARRLRTLLRG